MRAKKEDIIKHLSSIKETLKGHKEAEQIIDSIIKSTERAKSVKKKTKKVNKPK